MELRPVSTEEKRKKLLIKKRQIMGERWLEGFKKKNSRERQMQKKAGRGNCKEGDQGPSPKDRKAK